MPFEAAPEDWPVEAEDEQEWPGEATTEELLVKAGTVPLTTKAMICCTCFM